MGGEPPLCAIVLAQTRTHRVRYILGLPITPAIGEDAKNMHPLAVDRVCVELHLVRLGGRQPVGNQAVAKVGACGAAAQSSSSPVAGSSCSSLPPLLPSPGRSCRSIA
jgi:hypothetical protein